MNLTWGTWLVYPFMVFEVVVIAVWAYSLNKRLQAEGDESR